MNQFFLNYVQIQCVQNNVQKLLDNQANQSKEIKDIGYKVNYLLNRNDQNDTTQGEKGCKRPDEELNEINHLIPDDNGYVPLHTKPNRSQFMVEKKVIQTTKQESSSRSNYAIRLIPEVFTFIDLYRHTIRPCKGDGKLKLDVDKLNAIINSAMEYFPLCDHDKSKVLRNVGNHISNLNTFFNKLKNLDSNCSMNVKAISKKKLVSDHVNCLGGFQSYNKNRSDFKRLDTAIDKFITEGGSLIQLMINEGLEIYHADLDFKMDLNNQRKNDENDDLGFKMNLNNQQNDDESDDLGFKMDLNNRQENDDPVQKNDERDDQPRANNLVYVTYSDDDDFEEFDFKCPILNN